MIYRIKKNQKRCRFCDKKFIGSRSDTLYCSQKCRGRWRFENAKFETPEIPQSGIKHITYHRQTKRWILRINNKYLGSFKSIEEAKRFKKEYLGDGNAIREVQRDEYIGCSA